MTSTPEPLDGFDLLLQREDGSTYYRAITAELIVTDGDRDDKLQVFRMLDKTVAIHGRLEDGRNGLRWQLVRIDDPLYELAHRVSRETYHQAMQALDLEPIVDPNE